MDLIETARELARRTHAAQTRKDGVTHHIEHPLALAATRQLKELVPAH